MSLAVPAVAPALPPPLDLLPLLARGLVVTLELTLAAAAVGAVAALAAGLARAAGRPWRTLAAVYVETFRGTSALVQLFWAYFALPLVGVTLPAFPVAVLVLGLNTGAYGAEVVRGALRSVPRGQVEAATALGFRRRAVWTRIVLAWQCCRRPATSSASC